MVKQLININQMKQIVIGILAFVMASCASEKGKTKENTKLEKANLQEYYFPLNEKLSTITYKYKVTIENKEKTEVNYEYIRLKNLRKDHFSFCRYDDKMSLLDSTIFTLDQEGIIMKEYYLDSGNETFVKMNDKPQMLFKWLRKPGESLENRFSYESEMYGALTQSSIVMENTFKGFENLDNAISAESRCAVMHVKVRGEFQNMETGEEFDYISNDEIYDLKGIGLYKSVEENNWGTIITKELIDITK